MNIVLSMNSKYVMPSLVCMISILENNKVPINFYILYSQLEQADIDFMRTNIEKYGAGNLLIPIKIGDDIFADSPAPGRSKEAYFRLLIPSVLPTDIERCLYLDSDILVQGNLNALYQQSFEDKALVVCQDMGEFLFFHKERHELLGIPLEFEYFNSGVLLFNMEYFRSSFETQLFLDYIRDNLEKLKFLDQDVLNALLYDNVTFANSSLYNYMEILINPLVSNNAMEKAIIVHFLQKPWNYTYNGVNGRSWWKYAKKIYPAKYREISVTNFFYRKFLGLMLVIVSAKTLKEIKKIS
jgi:lipopolysaccharide biosynthesis glycosyltransferase